MAKKDSATKKGAAIDILLLLLVIVSSLLLYRQINDNSILKSEIEVFNSDIERKNNEKENLRQENEKLDEKYKTLLNIDDEILKAKDDYFNEISILEQKILNEESDLKIAYLTFDDGPYLLSNSFLDILDEYDIPATFFYLMKCKETGFGDVDEVYDQIYQRIINSGHTLGNHTASHKLGPEGIYRSVDAFVRDVEKNRNFIYERYGYYTDVLRFPGGSTTSSLKPILVEKINELGYSYVDWNSSTGDGGAVLPVETFRDNVLLKTDGKKILVVLMHDYSSNTLIALPEIIEGLSKQGYIFLPLFHDSVKCLNY